MNSETIDTTQKRLPLPASVEEPSTPVSVDADSTEQSNTAERSKRKRKEVERFVETTKPMKLTPTELEVPKGDGTQLGSISFGNHASIKYVGSQSFI
jgi:hypothetical protein